MKLLPGADAEELEIDEGVSTEESFIVARNKHVGVRKVPELHVARMKFYRGVIDRYALAFETNLRKRPHEFGFQANELVVGRVDPCASLERHGIVIAGDDVGVNPVLMLLLLLKMNLPRRMT